MKRIAIVRGAIGDMYEPAWVRSLRELGVQCQLLDPAERIPSSLLGRVQRRFLYGPNISKARRNVIDKLLQIEPDAVLLYQGHLFGPEHLDELRDHTMVLGYHNDDPFGPSRSMLRYRLLHKALSSYHGYHFYRDCNASEAKTFGLKRTGVVLPGYMPWVDYPRRKSNHFAAPDGIFFAGHCENDIRISCVENAIKRQIPIKIFGDPKSWNENATSIVKNTIGRVHHVFGDEYREAISNSAISLCFFSKKNRDTYTRRVFEITACAGFLLSERSEDMLEFFTEGKEAEYFSSQEEFIDKAEFYLRNDRVRRSIAKRGYERAQSSGYDVVSRTRKWLDEISRW